MYKEDIEGSIAHATMLGKCGIITEEQSADIVQGLKGILADIESGALQFDMEAEDIHTFIEGELTKRIGDNGIRLHTSRSRNDQVALDIKLYKGNIIDAGVTSPYSLYDEEIATFDEDEVYDQNDSAGFINLFGLPIKVRAKKGLIK